MRTPPSTDYALRAQWQAVGELLRSGHIERARRALQELRAEAERRRRQEQEAQWTG